MGRSAAELREDAIATGYFDGPYLHYQGDGFSVPWEVALPYSVPIGQTMYTYKAYLDQRWPYAARLHDWLYTPYGALISVTQGEADEALREEIAVDSTFDAAIVYASVAVFGHLYFGRSQTGYSGMSFPGSVDNITDTVASMSGVATMMKAVIVFQQSTTAGVAIPSINYNPVERTAGWTESVILSDDLAGSIAFMKGPRTDGNPALLPARAGILSSSGKIIGVRFYNATGGKGKFVKMPYDGSGGVGDVPSMSLLCANTNSFTEKVRRWTVRGVPDAQVISGEFKPTSGYRLAVMEYFQAMKNTYFRYKSGAAGIKIFNVSSAGLVTLEDVNPYSAGAIVTLSKVKVAGKSKTGQYIVDSTGPFANQFTVRAWGGIAGTGGNTTVYSSGFAPLSSDSDAFEVTRVTNHKVGRPFVSYRGRQGKKGTKAQA